MSNELVMTTDNAPLVAISDAQRVVLTQSTPPEVVKQRRGPGGKMLSYVEHSWVTATLNEAFGWAWSWDVVEWRLVPADDPAEVFVLGRLTVHTSQRDLVKTQFGSAEVKRSRSSGQPLSVGDDLKAASSDALKKCASLLGLALDLYSKDAPQPRRQTSRRAARPQPKRTPQQAPASARTEPAPATAPTNGKARRNGSANGSRSWKGALVQALLQEKLAQHPKHAVAMLNLSNLDPETASRLDAVAWARRYRQARESGLDGEAAAAQANGARG